MHAVSFVLVGNLTQHYLWNRTFAPCFSLTPRHLWFRFIPLPMAMAIPFLIGGYLGIDMLLGGVIVWIWQRVNRYSSDTYSIVTASGLIVGDGIWTVPSSILAVAGVDPPVCMEFMTKAAATAAAAAAEAAAA